MNDPSTQFSECKQYVKPGQLVTNLEEYGAPSLGGRLRKGCFLLLSNPSCCMEQRHGPSQRPWRNSWTDAIHACYVWPSASATRTTYNFQLYGDLPQLSTKIRQRRMRLAGHCWRHPEEIANTLVLWEPQEGTRNRGLQRTTYVDNLLQDTGMENSLELKSLMENRLEWKKAVASAGRSDERTR